MGNIDDLQLRAFLRRGLEIDAYIKESGQNPALNLIPI
jgi:hypothetical protein